MSSTHSKAAHFDTIVIGAGTAGLACASKLYEHPKYQQPNKLLVLEGRDRVGGRVGAVHVNGSRLDTGANWIHGIGTEDDPNPLTALVPGRNFRELSSSVVFRAPKHSDATQDERREEDWVDVQKPSLPAAPQTTDQVIPADIAEPLMGVMWGSMGALHQLAETTPPAEAKNTSMLQAFHKTGAFNSAFDQLPEEYHHELKAMPQWVEGMEAAPLAAQSAEHARDRPGMGLLEYSIEDFGGAQVFLRDGYLSVMEKLAKNVIDARLVQLNTIVKRIDWNAEERVTVETSKGTYTANRIVCTLPLGIMQRDAGIDVLNAGGGSFFRPALPADKTEAIKSLGFGTLDKIFMVYTDPWWTHEPWFTVLKKGTTKRPIDGGPKNDHHTSAPDSFLGFTEELPGIEVNRDGTSQPGIRMMAMVNLHGLTGYPVLSTFVSCANAMHVESLSDEDAGAIIHRSLTTWLGREPPKPAGVHVTRWAQDEFSQGSYSHMITGLSETKHREAFQKPVVGSKGAEMRFAGEHTSRNHFATVHGALISGWREADAILEAARQSEEIP